MRKTVRAGLPVDIDRRDLAFLPAALEIIETPPSPLGRATALTIATLAMASLLWASLGRVDIIVTAEGHVVQAGRTKTIQPFATSVVRRVLVADGQKVRKGDVLVELDPAIDQAEVEKDRSEAVLAELDRARLDALLAGRTDPEMVPGATAQQMSAVRAQTAQQALEQQARIEDLEHQIAEKQAEHGEAADTIKGLEATLPMLRTHVAIRQAALRTGYGNLLDTIDAQRELVSTEGSVAVARNKLTEADESAASLRRQSSEQRDAYRHQLLSDRQAAEGAISDHRQDLAKATTTRGLDTLRAPSDGTVQELGLHTPGGVVTAAQPLMVIAPDDQNLEIEAAIRPEDAGFVQPGQEAAIKVSAYDYTRYGLLHGKVARVSAFTVSTDARTPAPVTDLGDVARLDQRSSQSPEPIYAAAIRMREHSIDTEGGTRQVTPGMMVTVEIKTERRRVITYLLSPLARLRHQAMTER